MRTFIYLFVLCTGLQCRIAFSQADSTHHRHISIKPSMDFDQRFSFIHGYSVNIWGERVGILINEKFKTGLGVYYLSDRLRYKKTDSLGNPLYYGIRHLYFATVYYEPFFFRRNLWELSLPIEAGYGKSDFHSYDFYTNAPVGHSLKDFIPVGAGLSISFKCPSLKHLRCLRWLGINGLIGYRYDLGTLAYEYGFATSAFNTGYNGMFWSVSGTIFLDRATDDYKEWKKRRRDRKTLPARGPE